MEPIVEMKGISKRFGKTQANDCIDLRLNQDEILCLLGENGAGKSTLMKILYGMYRPDQGEIYYQGKRVEFSSSKDAISLGIQMVHQHFMLVPTLSVADNIVLGKEPVRKGLYNRAQARALVSDLSDMYGLKVSAERLVGDLSVGEQQRVEIIKALYQGAQVLILDEPTAVLTPQEVEDLFVIIRRLKADGKSIIIITHKLKETMAISDRVYVLREGRQIGECGIESTCIDELSEMMIGRKVFKPSSRTYKNQQMVLKLEGLRSCQADTAPMKDITFDVCEKEIVGIAGVEGNGQMELLEALSGMSPGWEGDILYRGESIKGHTTAELIEWGFSFIHADRHRYSVAMFERAPANFLLGNQENPEYSKGRHLLNWKRIEQDTGKMMTKYDVRPKDLQRPLGDFSGGNQQKFVVGREMDRNPCVLVAAHPTRGVDISATEFIHRQLLQRKEEGAGVLLISSDLDELMALSDRIAVIYDGRIVAFDSAERFDAFSLGKWMGGGSNVAQ